MLLNPESRIVLGYGLVQYNPSSEMLKIDIRQLNYHGSVVEHFWLFNKLLHDYTWTNYHFKSDKI